MILVLKALVLGIVEGVTEFLPISSTGHLIIAGALIGFPEPQRVTFDIFIQLGSILAVIWHYRGPLSALARLAPVDRTARGLAGKIVVAFLPAAAAGYLLHRAIEEHLFTVPAVAGALIAGGVLILIVERRPRRPKVETLDAMSWSDAVWIGAAQVTALIPGVSRAGATIIGGMLTGLSRPAATQFSFYLALPTLTAASLFSLIKSLPELSPADIAPFAAGFSAAFVSALVVIRSFVAYVQVHDFRAFGYYRIAVGLVLLALAAG